MGNFISIKEKYQGLSSLYLGIKFTRGVFQLGKINIKVNEKDRLYTGTLNKNGMITGLSQLYTDLELTPGIQLEFEKTSDNSILLKVESQSSISDVVEKKKDNLSWCFFEPLRITNIDHWMPNSESDILVVFGSLWQYTDYNYCCSATKDNLKKIGFLVDGNPDNPNKPDAILFNNKTSEYAITEFKMKSSHFKSNHNPKDIHVLFVWDDDEKERSYLPKTVISLKALAKSVLKSEITLN